MPLWIVPHIAFILGFLLAALVIADVLRQRLSPAGTSAWLLVIVLLPYVGVPLYLMLGGRKMRQIAQSKPEILLPKGATLPLKEASTVDRLLRSYQIPGATNGNRVSLCRTGEESYAALVDLIDQATRSLSLTTFILGKGAVGQDIIDRLARRAAEGINVRVLLDGVGSLRTTRRFLAPLIQAGGQVAFFMPLIHRPFRGRTNLRNHRKIVIADEQRVMAGGVNIAAEYIGPTPTPGRWQDLAFVMEGPAVIQYMTIFRSDWQFATREDLPINPDHAKPITDNDDEAVVQIVPSGPDVEGDPLYAALLSAVFSAKRRLWIITPYFVPNDALSHALAIAAHRGVDVRVLVPKVSNHRIADLARGTYLRELQAAGGTVMLYTPGMVHAKVLIMDEELSVIGSANMDYRSLFLNYEAAMIVYSKPVIEATASWFSELAADVRIGIGEVGTVRDVFEGVVRIAAPLL